MPRTDYILKLKLMLAIVSAVLCVRSSFALGYSCFADISNVDAQVSFATYYDNYDLLGSNGVPTGSDARVIFGAASGYIKNDTVYSYVKDYQGNIRSVVRQDGAVVESTDYYPYGTPFTTANSVQPYKYGAKELDRMHGLDLYDSQARWYDALTGRTSTLDPKAEKYYNLSPYTWCAGNPVRFVDPDGKEVIADEDSRDNIINTLTAEESNYVRFDKKGVLDTKLLNETMSTSIIMTALKALANSEINFIFQVLNKDHEGVEFYDSTRPGANYYRGVTEMPNADFNPSPDSNVYILVGSVLNKEQQVATTAHEAYGHGYFYQLYRNVQAASHAYVPYVETYFDEEFKVYGYISTKIPTNTALEKQIELVTCQAKQNYNERRNRK